MTSKQQSTDPIYTLAVASKLSGIPTHSIRQYIDKGLILPCVTKTNRHLFSEVDVERLINIKKYINEGLNIAGIKSLYAQIPGFLINECQEKNCNVCESFLQANIPCWITNEEKVKCGNKECRECDVYKMTNPVVDLRKYLVKIKKQGIHTNN